MPLQKHEKQFSLQVFLVCQKLSKHGISSDGELPAAGDILKYRRLFSDFGKQEIAICFE
jgi:hypothetical protein